ncbi:MAG TPA: polysaccharide biosynthesis tyrosine autokinase [Chloroflexi bacterium]|nr:polysaccharide biosynthesis tyrosine autokinase [Chloroflexota bacterium]
MNTPVGRYVVILKKWWWLFAIGVLVPAIIIRLLLSMQPGMYQARATLMIGTSLQNPEPDPWQLTVANNLANAYARLAREGPVMEAVITRLGLNRQPEQLAAQITTRVYPEAQLLVLEVVDADPRAAALIANALASELVQRSPMSQEEQAQRQAFIRDRLDGLEERIERLDQEIADLEASLVALTSATELDAARSRLRELEAVRMEYQATYASLLESYRTSAPNVVSVFEPAVEPTAALARRDNLAMAVAGISGLMLTIAGALLIEYLDDSVRWEEEMKQSVAGLPVLGALPKTAVGDGSIVEVIDPLSPGAEMARALRTNIILAAGERSPEVLLLTSPTLQDGKTRTVAQLGLAFVGGGRRVIMVDADLRKPSLHTLFDLPDPFGLAELLAGDVPLDGSAWPRGVQETGVEGLYLLPAGKPPLDPSRLLTSPRLHELLDFLKRQADVIVIDSPPELAAPDASVLASVADGTVLVVSAGKTSLGKIQKTRERLESREGVKLLGVTFNQVKVNGDYYSAYGRVSRRHKGGLWYLLRRRLPFIGRGAEGEEEGFVLSLAEMADYLGVSRATARRWCKSGRLPAFRSWFGWRIREEDLRAAMPQIMRNARV